MRLRNLVALLLLALLTFQPVQATPDRTTAQPNPGHPAQAGQALQVATMPVLPLIIQDNPGLSGYSVDVWNEVARRLSLKYEWVMYSSVGDILQAVKNAQADAAIAAISMTADRDAYLDFTYPYFDSGLQIMVRARPRLTFFQGISLVSMPFLLEVILLGLVAGLLMAHMIWLVERRTNPLFPRSYLAGVWEGLWWLLGIVASGAYRDMETKSVIKRMMTVTFWLFGVAIVAEFTATLTSALTIHQLTSIINGPSDLPGYRIASVANTTAADFLNGHNLNFTAVSQIDQAYSLLLDGQVEAVVFDAPVLLYYASHQGKNKVTIPGPMFHLEKYGIAVPTNSPLREKINVALLQMYQDGTLEDLQKKWFGGP